MPAPLPAPPESNPRICRAIIADDEARLRQALSRALSVTWPQLQVIASVGDGAAALDAIRTLQPDIAFLDIRMPAPNGLELARLIQQSGQAIDIVFVTAYDEYAVQAFEHHAVDYLLKPIDPARLHQTVERLQARRIKPEPATNAQLEQLLELMKPVAGPAPLRWLRASVRVAEGEEIRLVDIGSVIAFEAADKYIRVLSMQGADSTAGGRAGETLIRMPLKELLERLPAQEFWQIHRGTVVRVSAIKKTVRSLTGKLTVSLHGCNETFEVSRSFHALFRSD
jgi:DNA-binding LytR/AlgR family response regulator